MQINLLFSSINIFFKIILHVFITCDCFGLGKETFRIKFNKITVSLNWATLVNLIKSLIRVNAVIYLMLYLKELIKFVKVC